MKSKVTIVTDSTAQLPESFLQEHNVPVIPLLVNWSGESLLDGVDIDTSTFYQRIKTASDLPTTSQPSVGQFIDFFSQVRETAGSTVGIFISEPLSGTLDSARAAAQELADMELEIVDSRSTSMGQGLMVMEAVRLAEAGYDHNQIAAYIREMVPHMRLLFVVDTLEFLHRGGRIGGGRRFLGSVLSIKPILHLDDGRIEALASVRTMRKAIGHLLDVVAQDADPGSDLRCAVIHAAAPDLASELVGQLQARLHLAGDILVSDLSPVIGTHTGPGAVGVAYYDAAKVPALGG